MLILNFMAVVISILILGMVTSWLDRKVTARIQARIGPPWYQPVADVLKLLGKETLVPGDTGMFVFLAAPIVGFAGVSVAAYILAMSLLNPGQGFIGDVVVLVYFLMIPAITLILGASATGNPVAAVGASREMKQLLGYELPYLIAIAAIIITSGYNVRLEAIIIQQETGGWNVWSVSGIIGFIVFLLATQAKLGLVPFDAPEAEQELMGGIISEYSGTLLAVISVTKMILLAVMPLFMITLYMGGISRSVSGVMAGVLKYIVIVTLIVLIRNTNPRLRIDQTVRFFWGPVTGIALAGLAIAALGW